MQRIVWSRKEEAEMLSRESNVLATTLLSKEDWQEHYLPQEKLFGEVPALQGTTSLERRGLQ